MIGERVRVSDLEKAGDLLVQDGNHGEYRPRAEEFVADGIPFIRAGDLRDGRIFFDSADRINETAFRRIRKGIAHPKDVILTSKGTVGVVALARDEFETFACSPQTTFWRATDGGKLHHRYLYYYLKSDEFSSQINALKSQTDMAPYLSLTDQRRMWVRVPPLHIQYRIADILGALDDKIECNRQINRVLEAMAQALYQYWFAEADAPEQRPITDWIEIDPAVRIPKGVEVTYIDMKALPTWSMSVTETARRQFTAGSKFQNGDTLLARITPCLENGKTAFVDFLEDGEAGFGSTEFIVMRAKTGVSPQFVYCTARSEPFREHAIKSMVGSSGRQRVRSESFEHYRLPVFDEETMRRFDRKTEPWFAQIRANVKENIELARTRDYLLPRLLSGEIEVKAAEEIVEVV